MPPEHKEAYQILCLFVVVDASNKLSLLLDEIALTTVPLKIMGSLNPQWVYHLPSRIHMSNSDLQHANHLFFSLYSSTSSTNVMLCGMSRWSSYLLAMLWQGIKELTYIWNKTLNVYSYPLYVNANYFRSSFLVIEKDKHVT